MGSVGSIAVAAAVYVLVAAPTAVVVGRRLHRNQPQERPVPDTAPTRNPLGGAATKVAALVAPLGALIGAGVAYGLLTSAQASAVTGLLDAASPTVTAVGVLVAGVMPIVTALAAAFGTAKTAKPDVTPVSDPRALDDAGNLVALTPAIDIRGHA